MAVDIIRHEMSGELYAARWDEANQIIAIAGPLTTSEAIQVFDAGDADWDDEDLEWANAQPWSGIPVSRLDSYRD